MLKITKKVIVSGIISFIILSFFCFFYYNIPVHSICEDGSTDYKWQENKFYMSMDEGISFGKTDSLGYINKNTYDDVDILIMGSSHVQGLPVSNNDNVSTILDEKLPNKNVYSIATSGHNFKVCISNLEAALEKYKPEIVIIETNKLKLSSKEIEDVLSDDMDDIHSTSNKIVAFLQKNPFLRLSYSQIESLSNQISEEKKEYDFDNTLTRSLIGYISDILIKNDCKAIILFHPTVDLDCDGELLLGEEEQYSDTFKDICEEFDIEYIDMSDKYIEEYEENKLLPTGFINTAAGYGHINKNGHRMFAEEIYKKIGEME